MLLLLSHDQVVKAATGTQLVKIIGQRPLEGARVTEQLFFPI